MKLVELAFLSSWEPGLHAIVLSESLLRVNASCCAWLWSLFFCEYSWVHSLAAFLAGLFSTYTPCCLEWWHVAFPTLQHVPTGFKFCMVTVLVLSRACSCNLGPGIKALHVDSYRRCDNMGYLPKCGPEEQAQISDWVFSGSSRSGARNWTPWSLWIPSNLGYSMIQWVIAYWQL